MRELICIVCPKGCHLQVDEENGCRVTGNACPRGAVYGREELLNPVRTVTTTMRVAGGMSPRAPVKTARPVPKDRVFEAMQALSLIHISVFSAADLDSAGDAGIAGRTACPAGGGYSHRGAVRALLDCLFQRGQATGCRAGRARGAYGTGKLGTIRLNRASDEEQCVPGLADDRAEPPGSRWRSSPAGPSG